MSTASNFDLSIAAWLDEEARDGAPERLIDATRRQLERTNQRRAIWPAWRLSPMNARLAVAAAAVVIAAVGVYLILPRANGPGFQSSPSPTLTPASPTPTVHEIPAGGPLDAGRYVLRPYMTTAPGLEVLFTVPDGWDVFGNWAPLSPKGTSAPAGSGLAFLSTGSIYSDPCHWSKDGAVTATVGDVAVGPTAADLANAIHAQTAYTSTVPVDVTIDGYTGKQLDVELPSDIDVATECDKEAGTSEGSYWMWTPLEADGNNVYAQGPGERRHISIVDVEGDRLILMHNDYAGTSDADVAAAQAVFDSIEINP
ncbi:MAG TPA: hypothetical protein VFV72_11815 [Candidatus Limnocylindrales bacterium]|nr:hypothetical protein [Candidatus Limnocylindrales bacterium]